MSEPAATVQVYQLRIVLRGVSPLVWRRLLVRSDTTIAQLHHIIQAVMGWEDEHLHCFRIHGKDYGIARLGGLGFAGDPHAVTLAAFRLRPRERFLYTYDFGDWWQHDIRLEQVLAREPGRTYPICVGGQHAGPPEGSSGPAGYRRRRRDAASLAALDDLALIADFVGRWLEAGSRGTADEREEVEAALDRAQARARFIPGRFSRRAVNRALQQCMAPATT
jgi:hypothetical protein